MESGSEQREPAGEDDLESGQDQWGPAAEDGQSGAERDPDALVPEVCWCGVGLRWDAQEEARQRSAGRVRARQLSRAGARCRRNGNV